jgi:hypothetical protein
MSSINWGDKLMTEQPSQKSSRRVQVNIEMPSDLKPTYGNFVLISHSPSEMIFDFAQVLPQQPKARVQTRVIMTPLNAKLLYRALGENISKYEAQFGEIQDPSKGSALAQEFFSPRPPDSEGEE